MKESHPVIEWLPISEIILNPKNPREISNAEYENLKKSIQEDPEYFGGHPLIVSDRTGKNIIIAGNMRYRAAIDLKFKQVPCVILQGLDELKEKRIMAKDNGHFGRFDWDIIANEWDDLPLSEWGVDVPAWKDRPEELEGEKKTKLRDDKEYSFEFVVNFEQKCIIDAALNILGESEKSKILTVGAEHVLSGNNSTSFVHEDNIT